MAKKYTKDGFLTWEAVVEIAKKHYAMYTALIMLLCINLPRNQSVFLFLDEDYDGAFTVNREIVIGLRMSFFQHCRTAADVDKYMLNLIYHEVQHVKSTPDKAWHWGVEQGTLAVASELSKLIEGKGVRRISSDKDIENFCAAMEKQGFYVTRDFLTKFCHGIQNSLEDGRIERIGGKNSDRMRKLVIGVRGEIWMENEIQAPSDDPARQLQDVLNDVLSIATIGAHMKGFEKAYDGTVVMDLINKILPHIGMGVWSPTCRQCMRHSIDLEKALAELLKEALTEQSAMQQILQAIAAMMAAAEQAGQEARAKSNGQPSAGRGVTSKDEEADTDADANGMYNSLCNEAGDEDAKPESGSDEDKKDEKSDKSGSGKDGPGENGEEKSESKGKDGNESGSDGKGSAQGSGKSQGDEAGKDTTNGDPKQRASGQEKPCLVPGILAQQKRQGNDGVCGHAGTGKGIDAAAVEKVILAAMDIAAKESQSVSGEADSLVKKPAKPVNCPDKAKPWEASDDWKQRHKDTGFRELKRRYKVADYLPSGLQSEAGMFREKVEKLYQKRNVQRMTGRRSGRLDPNSFWQLKCGRSDVFMKKQEEEKRDYCVYILLDNSGSMGNGQGSKRFEACQSLAIIEEGFKNFVPMKIVAFDWNGPVIHEVIKGWDEKYDRNCSYNFMLHGRGGCGNMDAYDIEIATEELQARNEKKKLLIVMSDGSPSEDQPGDVQRAVRAARDGGIEVASIYFGYGLSKNEVKQFTDMYETNCVAVEPDKISEELARVLKKFCF